MAKIKQTAVTKDILINQGADFRIQLRLRSDETTPVDITGYTFKSKIRETADSDEALAVADCHIIDAPNGLMEIFFDDSATGQIPTDGDTYSDTESYVWDVYGTAPGGDTIRILNGKCYVSPGVSYD
jgi:hypothetical protein